MFFQKNVVNSLNSVSSAAALVFYLPGVCTHSDDEGKQRKAKVQNILKSSKKTQLLMNNLYLTLSTKKGREKGYQNGKNERQRPFWSPLSRPFSVKTRVSPCSLNSITQVKIMKHLQIGISKQSLALWDAKSLYT